MEAEADIADEGFLVAYEWHAYLSPTSTACDGRSPISSPDWHEQPALQYSRYSKYVQSGRKQAGSALTFQAAVASASTPATVYVAGGSSSVFCSAGFSDKLEVITTSSSAAAPAPAAAAAAAAAGIAVSAAPPARLSVARCGLAAASTGGGKVLLFAGGNSAKGYVDTVDVFLTSGGGDRVNPATVTVTEIETEPESESESEKARTASDESHELSTPIRMTQTTLALSEKRSWLAGGSGEAFAFFVGGATENPFSISSAVDVYDAASRTLKAEGLLEYITLVC